MSLKMRTLVGEEQLTTKAFKASLMQLFDTDDIWEYLRNGQIVSAEGNSYIDERAQERINESGESEENLDYVLENMLHDIRSGGAYIFTNASISRKHAEPFFLSVDEYDALEVSSEPVTAENAAEAVQMAQRNLPDYEEPEKPSFGHRIRDFFLRKVLRRARGDEEMEDYRARKELHDGRRALSRRLTEFSRELPAYGAGLQSDDFTRKSEGFSAQKKSSIKISNEARAKFGRLAMIPANGKNEFAAMCSGIVEEYGYISGKAIMDENIRDPEGAKRMLAKTVAISLIETERAGGKKDKDGKVIPGALEEKLNENKDAFINSIMENPQFKKSLEDVDHFSVTSFIADKKADEIAKNIINAAANADKEADKDDPASAKISENENTFGGIAAK